MSVFCLRNFSSNKVDGFPGKQLSAQEIEKIGPCMAQLLREGLVSGDADPVPLPIPSVSEEHAEIDNEDAEVREIEAEEKSVHSHHAKASHHKKSGKGR